MQYISNTEQDRREWPECVRAARRILNQPAFIDLNGGELSPGEAVQTDEQIRDWVARDAERLGLRLEDQAAQVLIAARGP